MKTGREGRRLQRGLQLRHDARRFWDFVLRPGNHPFDAFQTGALSVGFVITLELSKKSLKKIVGLQLCKTSSCL